MTDPQAGAPTSTARMLLPALIVAALAAGGWWLWGREGPTSTSAPTGPTGPRFLNASDEARYIGSDACTECHAEEAGQHAAHPHARSFGRVGAEGDLLGELWHERSAVRYRVAASGEGLQVLEDLRMEDGSFERLGAYPLTYWIGSGDRTRNYAAEPDGFMVVAPLVRNAGDGGWRIDPDCDVNLQPGFVRPVQPACVRCHAGRPRQVDGAVHRYAFDETAIGCERCHGPGSLHVEHQRSLASQGEETAGGGDQPDLTIANPAHMPPARSIQVCAPCHMSEALTVVHAGHKPGDWQPAQPWEDVQFTFRTKGRPDLVPQAAHVDQLGASRCFQQSQALTCTTCHGAHAHDPLAAVRSRTNAACAQCHTVCDREEAPVAAGDDCASCHMPAAEDPKLHAVVHDHRIRVPREDAPDADDEVPEDESLAVFLGNPRAVPAAVLARARGIAMAQHAPWFRATRKRGRAVAEGLKLLEEVEEGDVRARYHAALLAQFEQGQARARATLTPVLERLLTDEARRALAPEEAASIVDLYRTLAGPVQTADAQRLDLIRWLCTARRDPGDWLERADLLGIQGETDAAREAILKAVTLWPTNPTYQTLVAQILRTHGQAEKAARADRLFQRLSRQQSYVPPPK